MAALQLDPHVLKAADELGMDLQLGKSSDGRWYLCGKRRTWKRWHILDGGGTTPAKARQRGELTVLGLHADEMLNRLYRSSLRRDAAALGQR